MQLHDQDGSAPVLAAYGQNGQPRHMQNHAQDACMGRNIEIFEMALQKTFQVTPLYMVQLLTGYCESKTDNGLEFYSNKGPHQLSPIHSDLLSKHL